MKMLVLLSVVYLITRTLIVERTKFKHSTLLALRKAKEHARFCEVLVVSVHLRKISEKV